MSKNAPAADTPPVSAAEARALFKPFAREKVIALAISGGPDSLAMLWLAARWRGARKSGPNLLAFTLDHGLRPEAAREARDVGKIAASLGVAHRVLRWRGDKPRSGIQEAARAARYRLMIAAARKAGASYLLTAHTQDDQAETMMFRLARGSGLAGLRAMQMFTPRDGAIIARPFLDVSKARLISTLAGAGLAPAQDPSNADPRFARVRWRALMPALAEEGLTAPRLAVLARRAARADAALEAMVDATQAGVEAQGRARSMPFTAFCALADEIGLRLLGRLVDEIGHEGPAELAKLEALFDALCELRQAKTPRFKRTLAGALIGVAGGRLAVAPAPPRRQKRASARSKRR